MAESTVVARYEALCIAASDAAAAGDLAAEKANLTAALSLLAALPNSARGDNSVSWNNNSMTIQNRLAAINRELSAATGIRQTLLTPTPAYPATVTELGEWE